MSKSDIVAALKKSIKRYERLAKDLSAATELFEETGCAVCDHQEIASGGDTDGGFCDGCPLHTAKVYTNERKLYMCTEAYDDLWDSLDEAQDLVESVLETLDRVLLIESARPEKEE